MSSQRHPLHRNHDQQQEREREQQRRRRQQQQQQNRQEDEYLQTRRIAAETVEIGRATIEQASRQTEQLSNADRLADHNKYVLDKSARLLRGMTWSGWVANMFSKDIKASDYVRNSDGRYRTGSRAVTGAAGINIQPSAEEYQHFPPKFQPAAQAVVNYRCNLAILAQCQTPAQLVACGTTCNELSSNVSKELRKINGLDMNGEDKLAYDTLVKDLGEAEEVRRMLMEQSASSAEACNGSEGRCSRAPLTPHNSLSTSFAGNPASAGATAQLSVQNEHLDAISQNLTELRGIGEKLNTTFQEQNTLLDSLHDKSDDLTEQTKTVRRKAERITNCAKWIKIRPELTGWVTMRHVRSGLYLCVGGDGDVRLGGFSGHDNHAAVFGMWRRKESSVVGLQNKRSMKYLGQTMLGYLSCSSSKYGRAEEWEIDNEDRDTAIMCVGANWGNGGWLEVNTAKGTVSIGGYGVEAKKNAAMWRITEIDWENDEDD